MDKLTRHARAAPLDVRNLRPDVPEALSRVMLRMMAKKPKERFASFEKLVEALDEIVVAPEQDTSPAAATPPWLHPNWNHRESVSPGRTLRQSLSDQITRRHRFRSSRWPV